MRRNHLIRLKVTKDEKDRYIARAKSRGFATISAYVRWCMSSEQQLLEDMQEIKYLLKKNG